ncbi:MAG: hypothetical protein U5P41_16295 [Gammaproteobacteria bacterium]|nr:hypothetical protein [Gammaproteobacteria bacterium]
MWSSARARRGGMICVSPISATGCRILEARIDAGVTAAALVSRQNQPTVITCVAASRRQRI